MRMSQYVYFTLVSETLTADAVTGELGIEPDRTSVRGSRHLSPRPLPYAHRWEVHSPDRAQRIDVQADAVLARVAPAAEAIRRIVDRGDASASLVFVRNFNDESGTDENLDPVLASNGTMLQAIPGQHQILGWCLEPRHVALLAAMRSAVDADEYGLGARRPLPGAPRRPHAGEPRPVSGSSSSTGRVERRGTVEADP